MAPFNLTIVSGDVISNIESASDIELINFLALCQVEIASLQNIPHSHIRLTFNGINLIPNMTNLNQQIQVLGFKNGDVINVEEIHDIATTAPVTSLTQNNPTTSSNQMQSKDKVKHLLNNLVKNINVPTIKHNKDREISKNIFSVLPTRLEMLRENYPELAAAYEMNPANYENFHQAFLKHKAEQEKKARLMQDENSEEGQRYIAEQIAKENIEYSHQFAMEHMPEAFVMVHMLYIRMKINGHPVIAFVDSGAQVSILSESCATRCDIFRLVDTRYRDTAMGVGGHEKFLGRIHSCQVQVKDHVFACPFNVMGNRNVDILFGLNMLRRHFCVIDLKKNVLRFGDGTEAEFLSEEAYRREMEGIELEKINELERKN